MPAEPQRRHAQHGTGQQRDQASGEKAEPVAGMEIRGSDADRAAVIARARAVGVVATLGRVAASPRYRLAAGTGLFVGSVAG